MQKLYFVLSILFLFSCNEKEKGHFNEEIEQNDSTFNWLSYKENTTKDEYVDSFNHHFERLKKNKQWDSAAKTIDKVGSNFWRFDIYNKPLVEKAHFLLDSHSQTIQKKYIAGVNSVIGSQYDIISQKDSAIIYLKKGLTAPVDNFTLESVSNTEYILSTIYLFKGMFDSSLQYSLASYLKCEKYNKPRALGILSDRIGLFIQINNLDESKKSIRELDSLATLQHDSIALFNNYINKINLAKMKHYLEADYYENILAETKKLWKFYTIWKPTKARFKFLANIHQAETNISINDSLQAKIFLDSAKNILNKMPIGSNLYNEKYQLIEAYYNFKLCLNINEIKKYQALIDNHLSNKNYVNLREIYSVFADGLEKKGQYKLSLFYKKLEASIKDSLSKNKLLHTVNELDKKFQTIKKEQIIAEQKSNISASKFQITALLFSLVGLILGTLVFFVIRKRKEAQSETIRQQKFTDELLQNTEDERKRIATDLHDGVNHELLTLKNQATNGKPANADELEKVINEVRQVSRDLYPAMFDNIGLVASIEALCERMTEAGLFTSCEINYTLKLSKRNELQLYRIIQEALNNTLKHAKANAAKVTIDTVGNELQVEIKDNGIGFNTEEKMNSSSSFGIQSLMQRARAIGGKSTIESDASGTKLILKTPIR